MSVNGNIEVKGLSQFTAVNNLFVSGTITTSGSMQLGQVLVDGDSDLILSSSATSMVTISGNLNVLGNLTQNGAAVGGAASLLSSSGDSIIAGSGSIDFVQTNKSYDITSRARDLILSSSGGYVAVSGNLSILSSTPTLYFGPRTNAFPALKRNTTSIDVKYGDDSFYGSLNAYSYTAADAAGIFRVLSRFVLSPGAADGQLSIFDYNQTRSIALDTNAQSLAAKNGHLVLSSSAGSRVTVSGTLRLAPVFTAATLPASAEIVTGSIAYVSDLKCVAVFTPEGWMRLLSGTL